MRGLSRRCLPSRVEIKQKAHTLGFELAGIAPLGPFPESAFYPKWLESGYAGEMHYLERQKSARLQPESILPGAKSVIVCAMNYNTAHPLTSIDRLRAWISRYAWGEDYHEILRNKLEELAAWIDMSTAVSARSTNADASLAFVRYITRPEATSIWKAKGLERF